ncbi:iron-containing alcohol dehydrogenase [Oceanotoga teriensis]|uniref:Alcohol dehydrogenase class IV n=1 Tax=Oceanotoga teriensis TaxID=515440 RepID=A0AA45C6T0_9BACT|nr:iron-containing alcohol dehydrogenase [Oceanotoga teriensis]MDO7977262.1 iron-containing alcohol dehydrogenase [Oceanotoga teriensis]PWJ93252.1 alcohol dehydrogenase class IV [Oceanotoga teriensis]
MMRPMKFGGEQLMFGENSLEHLKTLKGKKAYIVPADFLINSDSLNKIERYLLEAGFEVKIFDEIINPDPDFDIVKSGAKKMLEFQPDLIVTIGGGSAMDAAKSMWVLYEHPEVDTIEKFTALHNNLPKMRNKAIIAAIPTTSGTASEVSRSVVISDPNTHKKCGVSDMQLIADIVILDPEMVMSMPKSVAAFTGMDALTHAIESYVSKRANFLSDVLSEKAIEVIFENMYESYNNPNPESRGMMHLGSCIAGMAFTNVSLGIVHSISHTIGSLYGVPHGLGNAILLPYIIEFNMQDEKAKEKYESLAKKLNYTSILEEVKKLNDKMNIPKNLKEYIKNDEKFENQIDEITQMSINDGCTKTNPIIPDFDMMKKLILKAYYGGKK